MSEPTGGRDRAREPVPDALTDVTVGGIRAVLELLARGDVTLDAAVAQVARMAARDRRDRGPD